MYSRSELADGFTALGVAPGDTVMLHASVRSIGPVAGGPDQIHLALKDALTEQGTLLMYASCPEHYDEIGLGSLTPEQEAELREKLPAFDPLTARCQRDNGALVELFRTYPGSRVNRHAGARFVAWGRRADHLFSEQPWNYAYGRGSALERFAALDGKILMLGADHDTVTFLHYAEHIADIPDKRIVRYVVPMEENGRREWRDCEEFDTAIAAHASWPDRFFATLLDEHLAVTGNQGGSVGDSKSYLCSARELLHFALAKMKTAALGG